MEGGKGSIFSEIVTLLLPTLSLAIIVSLSHLPSCMRDLVSSSLPPQSPLPSTLYLLPDSLSCPPKVTLPLEPPVVVPGRPLVFTVDRLLQKVTIRIHGEVSSFQVKSPEGNSLGVSKERQG